MPTLIAKVTLLLLSALITLLAAKRATAAMRHLLCVCALAGSLVLPVTLLFPARVIAIRLPAIDAVAASQAVARAQSWSPSGVMLGLWAFGCGVLILRLALGHWRIARLVGAATPIQPNELYLADVGVPIVCGLFRPVVLMPRVSSEWPAWQFDAAVRHELTHAQRKDLQANFIANAACAVWWFHPLAWLLARHLRDCQETACDDAVLFSGLEPATYAEALLCVAQSVAKTSTPTLLPGCPMTTKTNLKTRITRLLDHSIARTTSRANLVRTAIGFAIVLAGFGVLSLQKSSAQAPPQVAPNDTPTLGQVYSAGGDVASPRVIYKVDPAYTEEARQQKIAGSVMLSMVIGTDGLAHDISVTKSLDPSLDRTAAEAVEQWHFAPGTLKGEPVAVRAVIEVNFKLL
jgi:TonB family protein